MRDFNTSHWLTKGLTLIALLTAAAFGSAAHAQVKVTIYKGFTQNGGGASYSDPAGTINSPNIQFGSASGFQWHPYHLSAFGADATGTLTASAAGTYSFSLHSDDGSQLFIDGMLVVDNGGPHNQNTVSGSLYLTAGSHPFEIQFFENGYDDSGLDLNLPSGISYASASSQGARVRVRGHSGQHGSGSVTGHHRPRS